MFDKEPYVITIDKEELFDYLKDALQGEGIQVREHVLDFVIDQTLDYLVEKFEENFTDIL
jgi:hypothetical protein